jgi:hypothetical protein
LFSIFHDLLIFCFLYTFLLYFYYIFFCSVVLHA